MMPAASGWRSAQADATSPTSSISNVISVAKAAFRPACSLRFSLLNRADQGTGLVFRLDVLILRIGVIDNAAAGLHVGDAVLHDDSPDRDGSVDVTGEVE